MNHSKQIRDFVGFFVLFGVWSTWKSARYTFSIRCYSIWMAVAFIIMYFESGYKRFFKEKVPTNFDESIDAMLFTMSYLSYLIIAIESILRNKIHSQLLQKLSGVDRLISMKTRTFTTRRIKKYVNLTPIIILTSFLMCITTYYAIGLTCEDDMNLFACCFLYFRFIMHLRAIQVSFFVVLVQNRLQFIIDELKHIRMKSTTQINCIRRRKSFIHRADFTQILHLKIIYGELYETYGLINKSFGWSLLAVIIVYFADIIAVCYADFEKMAVLDTLPDSRDLRILLSFVVPIFIVLGTLCFYCSSCYQRVSSTWRDFIKHEACI